MRRVILLFNFADLVIRARAAYRTAPFVRRVSAGVCSVAAVNMNKSLWMRQAALLLLLLALAGCGGPPGVGQVGAPVTQNPPAASTQNTPAGDAAASPTQVAQASPSDSVATPTMPVASAVPTAATPATINLVDPAISPVAADDPEWQYRREATADLNGDGTPERAVLIAKVQLSQGQPVWDDSQPWQLYIEASDNTRTYVYARNVRLGTVETLMTQGASGSAIMLLERTPQEIGIYEIQYRGPNQAQVVEVARRELNPANGFAEPQR